jgi:RNA-binding protein
MTLTGEQRKSLKVHAHKLKPLIQVGKNGLREAQILTIKRILVDHELIKIKFNDYKKRREELSAEIIQKTGANLVDIIGNILIIYKQSDIPSKRKYSAKTQNL